MVQATAAIIKPSKALEAKHHFSTSASVRNPPPRDPRIPPKPTQAHE